MKNDEVLFIKNYLDEDLLDHISKNIKANENLFRTIPTKFGFNIPFHVIDGNELNRVMPELLNIANTKIKDEMEKFVRVPLRLISDPVRRIRIHRYLKNSEGFMWHRDGAEFTALIVLTNSLEGGTEIIPIKQSRWILPFVYLFPFTILLNKFSWPTKLFKPYKLIGKTGDASFLKGGRSVHRTTSLKESGDRQVLAISYDPVDKKQMKIWDFLANKLNYE